MSNTKGPLVIHSAYLFCEADINLPGTMYLSNGLDAALDFGQLAEAYHDSAKAVVQALAHDDYFVNSKSLGAAFNLFPVIHLYRHALELCIKGILLAGERALELYGDRIIDRNVLFSGHKLTPLWPEIKRVFGALPSWTYDMGVEGWQTERDFYDRLREFEQFDPNGMVVRYPILKSEAPSMSGYWLCMNVFDFSAKMDAVLGILRELPSIAVEDVGCLAEMWHEAREEAYEHDDGDDWG